MVSGPSTALMIVRNAIIPNAYIACLRTCRRWKHAKGQEIAAIGDACNEKTLGSCKNRAKRFLYHGNFACGSADRAR